MAPTSNGFEQLGRERKAFAIALTVWAMIPREHRTRTDLGACLAKLSQPERDAMAEKASKNPPSEKTWERVCALIDEKSAEERRFVSMLDDHRAAS